MCDCSNLLILPIRYFLLEVMLMFAEPQQESRLESDRSVEGAEDYGGGKEKKLTPNTWISSSKINLQNNCERIHKERFD